MGSCERFTDNDITSVLDSGENIETAKNVEVHSGNYEFFSGSSTHEDSFVENNSNLSSANNTLGGSEENSVNSDVNNCLVNDSADNVIDSISDNSIASLSNIESLGLENKLREWALKNQDKLCLNVVSELLVILRSEGFSNLPRTAQTLLGTHHHRVLSQMKSSKCTSGEYVYLGIKNGLEKIISSTYKEDEIKVFVHVDAMQLFNSSRVSVRPLSVKRGHKDYDSRPFAAAIFCGDSKPQNIAEYMDDFIQEANDLISSGLTIDGKTYKFTINGFIADSPARALIKCCKNAGGFYACERCVTRGVSVKVIKRGKEGTSTKRVYPEINCAHRTDESFRQKEQPMHHQDNVDSPLLKLRNFSADLIKKIELVSYANELLRSFLALLPNFYGKDSQVLNMHNLIHLTDDVEIFHLPLSGMSAFWGESFIGRFKKLIKSSKKPLTQIVNRLSEIESSRKFRIKKYLL